MSGHPTLKARERGLVTKATRKPTKAEDRALIGRDVRANYPHWDMTMAPALAVYHGQWCLTVKVHRRKVRAPRGMFSAAHPYVYMVTCDRLGVRNQILPTPPADQPLPKFPYQYACGQAIRILEELAHRASADIVHAGVYSFTRRTS